MPEYGVSDEQFDKAIARVVAEDYPMPEYELLHCGDCSQGQYRWGWCYCRCHRIERRTVGPWEAVE